MSYSAGPESWPAEVQRWQEAGGTHLSVNTMGAELEGPRAHIDAIRHYAEQVQPEKQR